MKTAILFLLQLPFAVQLNGQGTDCTFKPPGLTIHFGAGNVQDLNRSEPAHYQCVTHPCPRDGEYAYAPFTSDCFRGDWLTLTKDHTPGNRAGNMMLVNASRTTGPFLTTTVKGLKNSTVYEFGAWLMNVCRPTDKCPFPFYRTLPSACRHPKYSTV